MFGYLATAQVESATGIDINGDGRVGMFGRPNHQHHGGPGMVTGTMEQMTGMDLNGDGRVGNRPMGYGGGYNQGGYPPQNHGGPVMNAVETATGMDLNGDGRVAFRPGHHQQQYYPQGQQGYHPNQGGFVTNMVETVTGADLNMDGHAGYRPGHVGGYAHMPPVPQYGYGPQPGYGPQSGYGPQPGYGRQGGVMMNTFESMTGMDLNGDGRAGYRM